MGPIRNVANFRYSLVLVYICKKKKKLEYK